MRRIPEGRQYEKDKVEWKKHEGTDRKHGQGIDQFSAGHLRKSRRAREAKKVSLAWVVRDAAERYPAERTADRDDNVVRTVTENSRTLKFSGNSGFERE
jgi:hypothetical protein